MGRIIALKVDVSKIDKSRLFKGEKGTYLDLMVSVDDQPNQWGNDVSCWQGQTQEERQQKANRNFLGNGKTVWSNEGQYNQMQQNSGAMPPPPPPAGLDDSGMELPF